jgi:diaminopimelate decarboxylase
MFTQKQLDFFKTLQTPFFYYDLELLEKTLENVKKISEKFGYKIHYAIKANANTKLLKIISSYGFGADCVSGNEILTAIESGFTTDKIAFAGVGKSDREIEIALANNIFSLNSESWAEIEVIQEIAEKMAKKAKIALRLNPNLNANTHYYITTGLEENKFGINLWELESVIEKMQTLQNIEFSGLHFHLGSQITDFSVFKNLCLRINSIQNKLAKLNIKLPHLNLGGGLGIDYYDPEKNAVSDFETYFGIFNKFLEPLPGQTVHFEPGRSIIAQSGSLISKVLYIKNGVTTNFAILDAGMTELIRPALYQAYHKIENLIAAQENETLKYDVVGPICESSDCFAKSYELPLTRRGDLIALRSAGAYGEVMSSKYNLREQAKAYYSDEIPE